MNICIRRQCKVGINQVCFIAHSLYDKCIISVYKIFNVCNLFIFSYSDINFLWNWYLILWCKLLSCCVIIVEYLSCEATNLHKLSYTDCYNSDSCFIYIRRHLSNICTLCTISLYIIGIPLSCYRHCITKFITCVKSSFRCTKHNS